MQSFPPGMFFAPPVFRTLSCTILCRAHGTTSVLHWLVSWLSALVADTSHGMIFLAFGCNRCTLRSCGVLTREWTWQQINNWTTTPFWPQRCVATTLETRKKNNDMYLYTFVVVVNERLRFIFPFSSQTLPRNDSSPRPSILEKCRFSLLDHLRWFVWVGMLVVVLFLSGFEWKDFWFRFHFHCVAVVIEVLLTVKVTPYRNENSRLFCASLYWAVAFMSRPGFLELNKVFPCSFKSTDEHFLANIQPHHRVSN